MNRLLSILFAAVLVFGSGVPVSADGDEPTLPHGPWIDFIGVDVTVVRVWPVEPGGTFSFVVSVTKDGKPAPTGLLSVVPSYPFADGVGVSEGSAVAVGETRKFTFSGVDGLAYIVIPVPDDVLATGAEPVMQATVTYALPMPSDPGYPPKWYHGAVTVAQPIVAPTPEVLP
jgi:hypothetical protein